MRAGLAAAAAASAAAAAAATTAREQVLNGKTLDGFMISHLADTYAQSINTGASLNIGDAWTQVPSPWLPALHSLPVECVAGGATVCAIMRAWEHPSDGFGQGP